MKSTSSITKWLALASVAIAFSSSAAFAGGGAISNSSQASRLYFDLYMGQLPRMMVGYNKEYGQTDTFVMWDVYGTFRLAYEQKTPAYSYTTHMISDYVRLQVQMNGDELARFKDCMVLLSVNQSKRELASKLSPPQTIYPWAQLIWLVEPGSFAESMVTSWAFSNLGSPGANVILHAYPATHFLGCTTNL